MRGELAALLPPAMAGSPVGAPAPAEGTWLTQACVVRRTRRLSRARHAPVAASRRIERTGSANPCDIKPRRARLRHQRWFRWKKGREHAAGRPRGAHAAECRERMIREEDKMATSP